MFYLKGYLKLRINKLPRKLTEAHCVMIETISTNKMLLQLRLVIKIKDFKSKVRRINLSNVKSIKINSGQAI